MPKRIRSPSTSSPTTDSSDSEGFDWNTLDATKFVNLSAQHYYWDVLVSKTFVPERGLKPSGTDGKILDQIRSRGWILFVETPRSAPVAIVREFYANARETQNGISYVRGRQVPYHPQAINELFRMPTPTSEAVAWTQSYRTSTNLDRLVDEMCKPGTVWKLKVGTDQKVHFPQTSLNRFAKAWYSFLCASVLPTSHHQDVTVERATLLYGILKGCSMDMGLIINQSMLRFMRAGTSGGIPHASIILGLCEAAGVEWGEEALQLPMKDIDSATIRKYSVWSGGRSHPSGLGFIMPDAAEEDSSDEEAAPVSVPTPTPQIMEQLARQERDMRRLQRRMDRMHLDFHTYTVDFSEALTGAFAQLGAQVQFPIFGSSSVYPPPDTPSDEDDAAS